MVQIRHSLEIGPQLALIFMYFLKKLGAKWVVESVASAREWVNETAQSGPTKQVMCSHVGGRKTSRVQ